MALKAIIPAENKGAACYKGILFGNGKAQSAETWIWVANPPKSEQFLQLSLTSPTPTISPTFLSPTLSPISSITPITYWPGTNTSSLLDFASYKSLGPTPK